MLAALAVGVLKIHERVAGEELGQDYAQELSRSLLSVTLTPGRSTSPGFPGERSAADLSVVRTWVSQGIAPLMVAGPLLGGGLLILVLLDPLLAVVMGVPLLALSVCLLVWSRTARGPRRSGDASGTPVEDALDRTEAVGTIRAGGMVAATLTTLMVAAAGTYLGLQPGVTMAAMAVAGIASTPVLELGRIVEHRHTYRAARRALGPVLTDTGAHHHRATEQHPEADRLLAPLLPPWAYATATAVSPGTAATPITALSPDTAATPVTALSPGTPVSAFTAPTPPTPASPASASPPEAEAEAEAEGEEEARVHLDLPGLTVPGEPLTAAPGERIHLISADPDGARRFMRRLLDLDPRPDTAQPGSVRVMGHDLLALSPTHARELVGHAATGAVFEPGTVTQALHHRRPDLDAVLDQEILDLVGLDRGALPDGVHTPLGHGGAPLGRGDRARLALACAVHGTPPLLLVDGLESDVDDAGRAMLERVLRDYPGVVVLGGSMGLARRIGARTYRLQAGSGHRGETGSL